jgi:pyruvate formate lyase activating enzyme
MKKNVIKPIHSITPFTLLDYPHKSACILWFAGCNMRCLYCYNPEIVQGKGLISIEEALVFLHSRKSLLDGVVFSGGECLLHSNLPSLMEMVKKLGFLVKVDTNGSRPDVLQELIDRGLIDFVSLDFKSMPGDFEKITQSNLFLPFEKSLHLLIESGLEFEVRTTVHSDLIKEKDLQSMLTYLEANQYIGNYYIQFFVNEVPTLGDLGYSSREINLIEFSKSNIKVHFRG